MIFLRMRDSFHVVTFVIGPKITRENPTGTVKLEIMFPANAWNEKMKMSCIGQLGGFENGRRDYDTGCRSWIWLGVCCIGDLLYWSVGVNL